LKNDQNIRIENHTQILKRKPLTHSQIEHICNFAKAVQGNNPFQRDTIMNEK